MKKLFLIIISCTLLYPSKTNAGGSWDEFNSYAGYSLLYFMPHLFLDDDIKEKAKYGEYEWIIRKTHSPYMLTEQKYADYLDRKFLNGVRSDYFINFYEDTLKDKNNLLALSHYAGSIFWVSHRKEKIVLINDSIPASVELAAYYFSLMLEDPQMMYWARNNINFMLDYRKLDWEKVRGFCKNQEELNKVLSIEAIGFGHLTASVLENFMLLKGDINSEYFKLLLIKSTLEFEHKLKHHIKSKQFKNLYNYTQHLEKHEEDIYLDFLDFKKLLFQLNIKDGTLLHILRGYIAFIEADFNTAKQEYQYARYLSNQSNKTKEEKNQINTQIDFLNIVIDSYSTNNHESYNNFITEISRIINKIPTYEREVSYYKVGLDAALKQFDLVTAYQFSHFDDGSSQKILEILMNKVDLHKTLDLIKNKKLLFPDRFPINHEQILIETLALKFLRTDNFDSAISLLELLEKEDSAGLRCCQIPYYSTYDFYHWSSYDDNEYPKSPNHDSLVKKSWPYNSECYDLENCRYDKFMFEYEGQQTQHNKLSFIKEIKTTLDSAKLMIYGDEKSKLYYKLSQMYKEHFFNYNCIWDGNARFQIRSYYYYQFSILDEDFLQKKMTEYMQNYSTISRAEEYLKIAIRSTRNKELLAKYNFELLETYEEASRVWFTRRITTDSIVNKKEKEIKKLIDSLYTNTNYFNEVIKECATLYPKKKEKTSNQVESTNNENSYDDSKTKKTKYAWEIIFIVSIIILIFITKRYIKKEKT